MNSMQRITHLFRIQWKTSKATLLIKNTHQTFLTLGKGLGLQQNAHFNLFNNAICMHNRTFRLLPSLHGFAFNVYSDFKQTFETDVSCEVKVSGYIIEF